jgi:hypothetical protein
MVPSAGVLTEHEAVVRCGGADHVVRWAGRGRPLELVSHPGDRAADDVLVALSGAPARCRAVADAWDRLAIPQAEQLLDATDEQIRVMPARLPVVVEKRRATERRDDLSDAQRALLLQSFDAMARLCEVAALGPGLARRRAAEVAGPRWRRALRHPPRWIRPR